jgi:hypothetical protein
MTVYNFHNFYRFTIQSQQRKGVTGFLINMLISLPKIVQNLKITAKPDLFIVST